MVSETDITVRGRLGHNPELQTSGSGTSWLRLRVATNRRIRTDQGWADGPTSWYDVKLWGDFARNVAESVHKGDPVIVQGSLEIEEYINANNVTMRTPVIHAHAFGPDLRHRTARLTIVQRATEEPADAPVPSTPVDVSELADAPEEERSSDLASV